MPVANLEPRGVQFVTGFQLQDATPPMSRHQKQLRRLCERPPPSDFTWRELTAVLGQLGYRLLKGKGSRRKFFNEERDLLIICH